MNKTLTVTTFVLVAIMVGANIISPASAAKPGDKYWIQEQCDENNRCYVFVDVDGDGVCNLSYDRTFTVPRGYAEKLPVYEDACVFVF